MSEVQEISNLGVSPDRACSGEGRVGVSGGTPKLPLLSDVYRWGRPMVYLVGALFLVVGCQKEPEPIEPLAFRTVSGDAAMEVVKRLIAVGPRAAGSEGAAATAELIAADCRASGLTVTIDEWQEETPSGLVTFRNVIAEIAGDRDGMIVVGSHYDTKHLEDEPDFVGANDAGSSTGLLMVMAKELATPGYWRGPTLRICFFDGEEAQERYGPNDGLHGSRREAKKIAAGSIPCKAMILLDMIGDKDLKITFPSNCDRALVRKAFAVAEKVGTRDYFGHYTRGAILDDHVPFIDEGIPAIDFIDFNYGPRNSWWHTADDTLDKLDPKSLEITGNTVLALLAELAAE